MGPRPQRGLRPGNAGSARAERCQVAVQPRPTHEPRVHRLAIDSGLSRDLYVSLGEPIGMRAWTVRVYYKPFVGWIWGGALLMALGGGIALTDRRYALAARRERDAKETVAPAPGVPAQVAASVRAE